MRAPALTLSVLLALGVTTLPFAARSELAKANHSVPGTVDTHIVHVHDVYFHPEPLTGPWADHAAAQTQCEVADPPAQCNMNIEVGDRVEWWTKSPFHDQPHTITECTDNSFTNCGAAVDPINPIGDSGQFIGGAASDTIRYGPITFPTAGTFYYQCIIHPATMRGRVVVQAQQTPTPTPGATTAPGSTASPTPTQGAAAPAAVPAGGGMPTESGVSAAVILAFVGIALFMASVGGWLHASRRR
jgi:plastocyanin